MGRCDHLVEFRWVRIACIKGDVFPKGFIKEQTVLRYHRDAGPKGTGINFRIGKTGDRDRARAMGVKPGERIKYCCFARS